MTIAAWLVLRIFFAGFFLYPIYQLCRDWRNTVNLVKLISPIFPQIAAVMMICAMLVGGLMILLGFYAQVGGIILLIYSLLGYVVHYKLAKIGVSQKLGAEAARSDKTILKKTTELAFVGNLTSAQKNLVLAAVAFYFFALGSGPISITGNLFF